jgi:hypothetical protein
MLTHCSPYAGELFIFCVCSSVSSIAYSAGFRKEDSNLEASDCGRFSAQAVIGSGGVFFVASSAVSRTTGAKDTEQQNKARWQRLTAANKAAAQQRLTRPGRKLLAVAQQQMTRGKGQTIRHHRISVSRAVAARE